MTEGRRTGIATAGPLSGHGRAAVLAGIVLLAGCARPERAPEAPPPAALPPVAEPEPAIAAEPAASPGLITRAQALLRDLGYDPGPADGVEGPRTAAAVRAFQARAGGQADGAVTPALLDELESAHETDLVRRAQQRLIELGYDPGPADGKLGPRTRTALRAYQDATGAPGDARSPALLEAVLATETAEAGAPSAPPAEPSAPAPADQSAAVAKPEPADPAKDGASDQGLGQSAALPPEGLADHDAGVGPGKPAPGSGDLAAGERILLTISDGQRRDSELVIEPDGWLRLPEGGMVQAAGLGLHELENAVMTELLNQYLLRLERAEGQLDQDAKVERLQGYLMHLEVHVRRPAEAAGEAPR